MNSEKKGTTPIMLAQIDLTAAGTWATVLITIAGCYVAVKVAIASMATELKSLRSFVEAIARGDTGLMGEVRQKIDSHVEKLAGLRVEVDRLKGKVSRIETEHGMNHPHCGGNTTERSDDQ